MSATKSTIPAPPSAVLRCLYVGWGLGCPEIGTLFGRDGTTVRYWLQRANIPTRPRGHNPAVHFKKGERSAFAGRKHRPESIALVRAATVRDGRVPYRRGGKHWLHTVPAQENPNWKGGVTPERQEFYRSQEWKDACTAVWARADACCERCRLDYRTQDRATERFHVHHIVPFAVKELRAAVSNLALLCRACHLFVHSSANTAREFLPADSVAILRAEERQAATPSLFDLEAA